MSRLLTGVYHSTATRDLIAQHLRAAAVDGARECVACGRRYDTPLRSTRPLEAGTCCLTCALTVREARMEVAA